MRAWAFAELFRCRGGDGARLQVGSKNLGRTTLHVSGHSHVRSCDPLHLLRGPRFLGATCTSAWIIVLTLFTKPDWIFLTWVRPISSWTHADCGQQQGCAAVSSAVQLTARWRITAFFPLKFSFYEFNTMMSVCFFRGDSELHLQFNLKGLHVF